MHKLIDSLMFSLLLSMLLMISFVPVAMAQSWRDRVRPLIGGVQIQNDRTQCLASIGFTAYWEFVDHGVTWRTYGFVTASHFANHSDAIYQNITGSNNYVGSVIFDPSFPRRIDSLFVGTESVIKGTAPTSVAPRVLIDPNCQHNVHGYKSRSQMRINERVYKVGRTTGRTEGSIVRFVDKLTRVGDTDVVINYYVAATFPVQPGDSGGTVYRIFITKPDYPTYLYIYGTVIGVNATHAFFSPTDGIISDLGINVFTVYSGY
jgi:hypothetical protein